MALVLGAVALVALGGTALADRIPTKVTLENYDEGVYIGTVKAEKGCHKDRRVLVYHDTNGNGEIDPSDYLIGSAKTDDKGNYRVEGDQAPFGDRIIAVVKPKKRGDDKCKKAKVVETAGHDFDN